MNIIWDIFMTEVYVVDYKTPIYSCEFNSVDRDNA